MQTEPNIPAAAGPAHAPDEQRLAAALRDLLQYDDFTDYRDSLGRAGRDSPAYRAAQALVEHFGLTHDQLVAALDHADLSGDLTPVARRLVDLRTADPSETPPEYRTWHTGP
ncbi:hypothetical protein LJR219_004452 [Phenylobacterium sp. LjRoot219]|uniref:hypothetical protein n=1 Tax=Phenylobacterium sp. LjRoot219 TaxID=3342283 RepID=UPI003ECD23B6